MRRLDGCCRGGSTLPRAALALLLALACCAAPARADAAADAGTDAALRAAALTKNLGHDLAAKSLAPEIGASVMLLGKFDWELERQPGKGAWSRCMDQMWRAAERSGSSQVNFVPTHHWVPAANNRIASYCVMTGTKGVTTCEPWTRELIKEFKDAMTVCFAKALVMGLTIHIRPHLDDSSPTKSWRNALDFKPEEAYGGFSYKDIMLDPLADALRTALRYTVKGREWVGEKPAVYFSLQGEMGATIMKYPRSWAAAIEPLRQRVGPLADVLFGIGINFTGLRNSPTDTRVLPIAGFIMGLFGRPPAQDGGDPQGDPIGVKDLIENRISFIGISAYAPMTGPGFPLNEFENAAFMIKDDLATMGIDLAALINSGSIELHYSEFGIGGADRTSGQPADDPKAVATFPFAGVDGPYRAARDPWKRPQINAFLREFYGKVSLWLATPYNKTFRLSRLFIWSHASFDILGVYPESKGPEGTYYDEFVGGLIYAHNAKFRPANTWASVKDAPPAPPAAAPVDAPPEVAVAVDEETKQVVTAAGGGLSTSAPAGPAGRASAAARGAADAVGGPPAGASGARGAARRSARAAAARPGSRPPGRDGSRTGAP
ncbi:MAG: hypothetical protein J3K34DRAFT_210613 [Monoraphidium minutum]|nr:MAG: hypothetical protein J3K34DRAFT_210613 [Monoraphidium minutum]